MSSKVGWLPKQNSFFKRVFVKMARYLKIVAHQTARLDIKIYFHLAVFNRPGFSRHWEYRMYLSLTAVHL